MKKYKTMKELRMLWLGENPNFSSIFIINDEKVFESMINQLDVIFNMKEIVGSKYI